MSFKKQIAIMLCLLVCICSASIANDGWNQEFTRDGITVFTRPVSGSPLNEFKAVGLVNASMETCQKVLMDISNLKTWMPDCITSRPLSQSGNIVITYTETKAPWPVSNRDMVSQSVVTTEKDRIIHNIVAINRPDLVAPKGDAVRITSMNATWVLARQGNQTLAYYQVKVNPAGNIPAALANSTSKEMPYKTIAGLRTMAANPRYR